MSQKRTKCDLCQSPAEQFKVLFRKDNFSITKCKNCGLEFSLEIPSEDELHEYYDNSYYEGKIYPSYSSEEAQRKRYYCYQLAYFENFHPSRNGKLLEVGCATGTFLDCARFFGYDIVGTEKSLYSAEIAKAKNHIVFVKDLDQLVKEKQLEKGKFDAVFMWDVLEHVSNPFDTLKNANYVTRKEGLLTINTLNISSPTVKYLGKEWSHFFPPHHLFYYGLKTLKLYLSKTGYSILKLRTSGPLFYDDLKDKYYILKGLFSNYRLQRFTNKLKLGYVQFVIAKKIREA